MEDPAKVKKIKDQLNKEAGDKVWDDVIDLVSMPRVTYNPESGGYTIDTTQGTTVKMFTNLKTGELKLYWIGFVKK